ncbi:MAG TPA: PstS family phosphate ABC transporter substrate-binding protein [Solirubrobacterales bacterium]|nr:PstS family phosphate ABC transporter substrate-binding protein [Solirubrobacterales bacterium]
MNPTQKETKSVISRKGLPSLAAGIVLALGVVACGDDDGGEATASGGGDLSGSISIDGSSTVEPFAQAAAELFADENPDVSVNVGASGTSGGFEKFCAGETDISDASRPIEPEEEKACADGGVEYSEVPVANDGISVVTNPGLEISCLTTEQLQQLWVDDKVTNYSELGEDADTGEPLPDTEVSLYGPGTDSGTFDYFTDVINGEEGVSRKEYQASEDDNVLVQGVSGDAGGLAYFGFSYYEQNADALNLVSVDDGDGCVTPSLETIQDGSYAPLSRPIFMYPSAEALQKPEVAAFMQFIVDNYDSIAEAALMVPLDEADNADAKAALEQGLGA